MIGFFQKKYVTFHGFIKFFEKFAKNSCKNEKI